MTERHYVVGVPLAITVDHDGRVTLDVDLSEITDFTENIEGDYDATARGDEQVVSDAAARVGNCLTITINPDRRRP